MKVEIKGLDGMIGVLSIDNSSVERLPYIAITLYKQTEVRVLDGLIIVKPEELKAAVDSIVKLCPKRKE